MDYTKNISIKLTEGEAKKFYDLCDFYSLPKWTTARLLVFINQPWSGKKLTWAGFDMQSPKIARLKMAYGEELTMNLALALAKDAHRHFFGGADIEALEPEPRQGEPLAKDACMKMEDLARVLGCPSTNEVFEFLVNWAYRFNNGLRPPIARDSLNLHYVIPEKCNDTVSALKRSLATEHKRRGAGKARNRNGGSK